MTTPATTLAARRATRRCWWRPGLARALLAALDPLLRPDQLDASALSAASSREPGGSRGRPEDTRRGGGPVEIATLGRAFNEMANSWSRDASERDRVEQMKDDFVLTVSHELRTPVTVVKGFAGDAHRPAEVAQHRGSTRRRR